MTYDRAMELLEAVAEYALVGNSIQEAISELISIGFTKDELVNDFYFSADDVYSVDDDEVD